MKINVKILSLFLFLSLVLYSCHKDASSSKRSATIQWQNSVDSVTGSFRMAGSYYYSNPTVNTTTPFVDTLVIAGSAADSTIQIGNVTLSKTMQDSTSVQYTHYTTTDHYICSFWAHGDSITYWAGTQTVSTSSGSTSQGGRIR